MSAGTPQSPQPPSPGPPGAPEPQATPQAYYPPPPWWVNPPRRKSILRRILTGIFVVIFILSILVNIDLAILLLIGRDAGLDKSVIREGESDQTVAVFAANGVIDERMAATFERFTRIVREKEEIKAVVVRVDSPGGGVSASDRIHSMVKAIREKARKPVIVSMGGVAASGGYYISASADEIYAEPTTATGSIGVIAGWPVLKGLLDKIGVEMVIIRSTGTQRWKAAENPWETPDPRVRRNLRELLDKIQTKFEQAVLAGRKGKLTTNDQKITVTGAEGKEVTFTETEPFNGQVYLAADAKRLGLIDKVGYLSDAVDAAAERARLSNPKVVRYARPKSLPELMGMSGSRPLIDPGTVDRAMTPRIMMLWRPE